MEGIDLATFNQAIRYAQSGYKEKAFDFIKILAQKDANNMDLIFWGMYTAPNVERAELLFNRAKLINPDHTALFQAQQWLTNEKMRWPHPAEGYSLFPPNNHLLKTSQVISEQIVLPIQPIFAPQPPQVYPAQPYYQAPPPAAMYAISQPIIINNAPAYSCPYCRNPFPPLTNTRISTSGWITFVVLLFLFFPLCWVGLFSKTSYTYCGRCGVKFN